MKIGLGIGVVYKRWFGDTEPVVSYDKLLLEDNIFKLLLEDGSSYLLLEF